ncbi:MAG: flavin reductase family protein [Acidimicrobiales bacterium]
MSTEHAREHAREHAGEHAEDYDRLRRRLLWSMPGGIYVVGSRAGEQRNLMTTSWAIQVATEPKLVMVSVEVAAVTHRLVADGGVFSLCTIAREDRAIVRKFVKPVAEGPPHDGVATLNGFPVTEATTGAPILVQAVGWLDCRVRQALEAGSSHTCFVGEVVAAGFNRDEETPVLRMEDTRMSYGG